MEMGEPVDLAVVNTRGALPDGRGSDGASPDGRGVAISNALRPLARVCKLQQTRMQ